MKNGRAPWYYLVLLVLSGEMIFALPFVLPRVFRPTVLETFQLDNVQLGLCFSIYGIVALLSYLLGGPLADKYAPRKLIATALFATGVGGFFLATFPSYSNLKLLYGYWGFTTIFLFWAPMIKATRIWGGQASQGKAFGFLEGGRGLVAAVLSSFVVLIFSFFLDSTTDSHTLAESRYAYGYSIRIISIFILLVAIFVWQFMKSGTDSDDTSVVDKIRASQIREVFKMKAVVLLMIIILCAYVGYKTTDMLSLYANEVMNYNQVDSALVGTFLFYIRPATGIVFGIFADRWITTRWLFISFVISLVGSIIFATGFSALAGAFLFFMSIVVIAIGIYATRSLYFAVMQSGKIPLKYTGTAVGLVSLVGYTPDIFSGPMLGYLLDNNPGELGFQYVFWVMAGFSLVGAIAAYLYHREFGTGEYSAKR